jgi:hypothetical protein
MLLAMFGNATDVTIHTTIVVISTDTSRKRDTTVQDTIARPVTFGMTTTHMLDGT